MAAIVKSWNEAVAYYKSNPDESIAIMAKGVGGWLFHWFVPSKAARRALSSLITRSRCLAASSSPAPADGSFNSISSRSVGPLVATAPAIVPRVAAGSAIRGRRCRSGVEGHARLLWRFAFSPGT